MKTVIEMARLATNGRVAKNDAETESLVGLDEVTRFAELVRADQDEKYKWDVHSCGPTCTNAVCVAIREAVEATRNATLDEIATKIEAMPFGDTAASFAVWIREQKI